MNFLPWRSTTAVTPLLRGMECPLTLHNSQDADEFLEEAGRALQAAIKGIAESATTTE